MGGLRIRWFMGALASASVILALHTFHQSNNLLMPLSGGRGDGGGAVRADWAQDRKLAAQLMEFPRAIEAMKKRAELLEQSIQVMVGLKPETAASSTGPAAAKAAAKAPAAAAAEVLSRPAPPSGVAAVAAVAGAVAEGATEVDTGQFEPGQRFRKDGKCGKNAPSRLQDGALVECDASGNAPCCSREGECTLSDAACNCKECLDYRVIVPAAGQDVPPPLVRSSDQQGDSTVVVVIPFRDREGHLVKFKQYWRWFARSGNHPRKVKRWEIFVVEQFDSLTFSRGWCFNVGLAVATAQKSASEDLTSAKRLEFDCAVVQDIDYLPEKKVDYSECEVPMQLSSEIDRYGWKTPYEKSAGGIVGMSEKHWRQINGFGNNYFGWGGEDDELHHRLRLNNLLYGDCYPHCQKNDHRKGKTGIAIKRPPKGHGRFSGEHMHSANHTKRITDAAAYKANLQMLAEIANNGNRWKSDGLSSLAFRIVDMNTDKTDSETFGITYHHVRAHRGKHTFDLHGMPLAVPLALCKDGAAAGSGAAGDAVWTVASLGSAVPYDLASLRALAIRVLEEAGGSCSTFFSQSLSFLLVDRRRNVAKILSDGDPHLLLVFYRSLFSPYEDGLIIADARGRDELRKAIEEAGAFVAPGPPMTLCTARLKVHGPKYSIQQSEVCTQDGWDKVMHGTFQWSAKSRPGLFPVTLCSNHKYWTQRVVKGDTCDKNWGGLHWKHEGTFWAARGDDFCVGSRKPSDEELRFSRILRQANCDGGSGEFAFKHDFTFSPVKETLSFTARVVCVGRTNKGEGEVRFYPGGVECFHDATFKVRAVFVVRQPEAVAPSDKTFCVDRGSTGDSLRQAGQCNEEAFSFAIPGQHPQLAPGKGTYSPEALRVCASGAIGGECDDPLFQAPSALDIAASVPRGHGGGDGEAGGHRGPLFTLVEEALPCFGFVCPATVRVLFSS